MTFRVVIVKKDGRPIGVRAAQINGRIIYLALRDELEPMNWYDAVKVGIPSKEEWIVIDENFIATLEAFEIDTCVTSFKSKNGAVWHNCRPVRKDEVTFYEDKKDE